jgi:hypothetical protein
VYRGGTGEDCESNDAGKGTAHDVGFVGLHWFVFDDCGFVVWFLG